MTPEDVIFTLELLRDKGRPLYGARPTKIAKMEKVGEHGVRLTFNGSPTANCRCCWPAADPAETRDRRRELRQVDTEADDRQSAPIGSTASGRAKSSSLKRNPDYWAKDMPSKRGFDNYDEIRMNYYRDENTMFEAFKKGVVDVFMEENTGRWAERLQFPGRHRRRHRQGDVQDRPAVRHVRLRA